MIENDPDDPATWVILCNACDIEAEYRPLALQGEDDER